LVTSCVQTVGHFAIGVLVQELIEQGHGSRRGLPFLPGRGWDRNGQTDGLAPAEPDVQVDHRRGLVKGDVVDE
jgi:hypothetical protein